MKKIIDFHSFELRVLLQHQKDRIRWIPLKIVFSSRCCRTFWHNSFKNCVEINTICQNSIAQKERGSKTGKNECYKRGREGINGGLDLGAIERA